MVHVLFFGRFELLIRHQAHKYRDRLEQQHGDAVAARLDDALGAPCLAPREPADQHARGKQPVAAVQRTSERRLELAEPLHVRDLHLPL